MTTKIEEQRNRIQRYYQRFQKAEVAKGDLNDRFKVLDTFDRGEQWKDANLPPWVPKPVTNFIRYVRTLKRANLASAIPMATFTAEYQEDAEIINRLDKAYRHVWQKQRVPRVIRRSIDRSFLQGTAIVYVYSDDDYVGGKYIKPKDSRNVLFQGDIQVKRYPSENFFPDPDAYCLEDMKWCETTEPLPLAQIKENTRFIEYTKKNGTYQKFMKLNYSTLSSSSTDETGEIFDRDVTISESNPPITGDEMILLHTHYERYYANGEWHLDVTYYLPFCDFELLRIEDYKPNEYPFAVLYDEEEDKSFWGSATAWDFLENQKVINKTQQTSSVKATLHQNPQKVVSRDSGINARDLARSGTQPGRVWTTNSDPRNSIVNVVPPDIPRGLMEVEDRMKQDIREMAGVNEAYTGQSVGSLTTSSGVNSLIERATIRDKDKMVQIDAFVERISHLIVLNILHKWEEERPLAIEQPDGTTEYSQWQPIAKELRDNLSWRVKVDVYAKAPTTQASKRQQADQLMQYQGQFNFDPPIITQEEWIQLQDFEDKEKWLRRIQEDRAKKEAMEAMNWTQIIMQTADQVNQLRKQGMGNQEIQPQIQQFIQEMVEQQKQMAVQRPRDAAAAPGERQGVTGQQAMSAMIRGA